MDYKCIIRHGERKTIKACKGCIIDQIPLKYPFLMSAATSMCTCLLHAV